MPVAVEHIRKHFDGGVTALEDISLTVKPGEFVAIVGPSGCGKSTLLNIMAGLDTATSGTAHLHTRPAVVFQEAALFPWRTVRQNVAFGLQMDGVSKNERLHRADDALRLVHLSDFAEAFPHTLSGGMRQRAAIARALAVDSDLLLMDEPFAALDAQTRSRLQSELLDIWQTTRRAVVLVTHSLDEALTLADRIVLMSARPGRIVGDWHIEAPHPRDPVANSSLAALRRELLRSLANEVDDVGL